ncbi:GntR family transcriptional regulator [Neobacillus drentensis]|uniref:GntR family transcriptional regulator n=1 Tax=Neobacillus drentensis TaxID=220684 RepID=UPI001F19855C|nr:GntR family transcriptional regulator [Neobacillus drentensis]ULT59572.1 GntR family transcriptional regulator [Neobacillus drentensis]
MKNTPKYTIVEDYLINRINSGELKVGDQIETEEQLAELFGYSRMTINKALNKLVEKKYITRISGKGSFVSSSHVTKSLENQSSFSEDMRSIGLLPGSKLLSYKLIKSNEIPVISKKIDLKDNVFVHYFVRLRTGNGNPIAISYNYVSTEVLPAINVDALNHSFYDYLKSLGYSVLGSELEMEAVLPTPEQKKLLQIDQGALLKSKAITTVSLDGKESILGYFETFYNGNTYTYKFNK